MAVRFVAEFKAEAHSAVAQLADSMAAVDSTVVVADAANRT
jgi:hypothetical protein